MVAPEGCSGIPCDLSPSVSLTLTLTLTLTLSLSLCLSLSLSLSRSLALPPLCLLLNGGWGLLRFRTRGDEQRLWHFRAAHSGLPEAAAPAASVTGRLPFQSGVFPL